jgi:hypothetical protein
LGEAVPEQVRSDHTSLLRGRWRSTNLPERSLGEVRRHTKVMGRFPGETSCLSLVWAVLDLFFSHANGGATFTDVDRQHLYRIKYQQADPDPARRGGHRRIDAPRDPEPRANFPRERDATPARRRQSPARRAKVGLVAERDRPADGLTEHSMLGEATEQSVRKPTSYGQGDRDPDLA